MNIFPIPPPHQYIYPPSLETQSPIFLSPPPPNQLGRSVLPLCCFGSWLLPHCVSLSIFKYMREITVHYQKMGQGDELALPQRGRVLRL